MSAMEHCPPLAERRLCSSPLAESQMRRCAVLDGHCLGLVICVGVGMSIRDDYGIYCNTEV